MSTLESISIHIASADEMLSGQAEAVLVEIAELLGRMVAQGEENSIDIRGLPLTRADRAWLEAQLGRGEVEIVMEAGGTSHLLETAYPGVWIVTHHDPTGRVVAELIEIAQVPAILKPDLSDIEKGYKSLLLELEARIRVKGEGNG